MLIPIENAVEQTIIFGAILVISIFLSLKRSPKGELFSLFHTQEIKGFAILSIVFAHVGYYLVTDTRFLFPLSILAGVGIDLFLFLSAFGLTTSALNKKISILQFYKRRLFKLFIPLWIILPIFLLLDYFFLHITYSWDYIVQAFAGIFTHANLYEDINSPFWYFTFILFYYLLFPILFQKKRIWLSAILMYLLGYLLVQWEPTFLLNTIPLYKIHLLSFPLGMLVAWGLKSEKILSLLRFRLTNKLLSSLIHSIILIGLLIFIGYTAIHSGVGKTVFKEQLISLLTMKAIIILFLMKKFESKCLYLFGLYSYELYLFHWPIMYRYDIFYKYLPAWLSLSLYLCLFLCIGWGMQKLVKKIGEW